METMIWYLILGTVALILLFFIRGCLAGCKDPSRSASEARTVAYLRKDIDALNDEVAKYLRDIKQVKEDKLKVWDNLVEARSEKQRIAALADARKNIIDDLNNSVNQMARTIRDLSCKPGE